MATRTTTEMTATTATTHVSGSPTSKATGEHNRLVRGRHVSNVPIREVAKPYSILTLLDLSSAALKLPNIIEIANISSLLVEARVCT